MDAGGAVPFAFPRAVMQDRVPFVPPAAELRISGLTGKIAESRWLDLSPYIAH